MEPVLNDDNELSEDRFSYQKVAEQEIREAGTCIAAAAALPRQLRLRASRVVARGPAYIQACMHTYSGLWAT